MSEGSEHFMYSGVDKKEEEEEENGQCTNEITEQTSSKIEQQ